MDSHEIRQLGRYTVHEELGRGAMGVVFRAADPVIGRTVALKTLVARSGLDDERRADDLERFLQEARAAGRLSHPGIVTVYDAGRDEESDRFFLAMEYVPGRTLRETLPLEEERAGSILRQIATALAYAHEQGIVHRDLKPANILIGEDGAVKITDFGIARIAGSDLTRDGESLGSPAYMSPEQVLGRCVDRRSDLFSLGVLLYEMLSGRRPFEGENLQAVAYQVVHESPPPIRSIAPGLSPRWGAILGRLLAKPPAGRYPDASALLADLEGDAAVDRTVRLPRRGAASGATERLLAHGRGAGRVVRRGLGRVGQGLGQALRRAKQAWPREPGRRQAIANPFRSGMTGLLTNRRAQWSFIGLVVVSTLAFSGLLRPASIPLNVTFKHGLEAGRLRIEVDGSEQVDLNFEGNENAWSWLPGLGKGGSKSGRTEIPLRLRPGKHELVVGVVAEDGQEWSRSLTRAVASGQEATLEVRVGTRFHPGLSLDWNSREARDGR